MHKQVFDNLLQASKNLLNPHAQGNESESYVLKDRGLEKLKEDTKDIKLEEKEIKKDEKDEKEDDNLTQYSKNGSGSKMKNFMRIPSHPIQSIVESNNAQVNLDFFNGIIKDNKVEVKNVAIRQIATNLSKLRASKDISQSFTGTSMTQTQENVLQTTLNNPHDIQNVIFYQRN